MIRLQCTIGQAFNIPGPGGHGCGLHATICCASPGQLRPPCCGAGLVQLRVCVSDPPPHVTVHLVPMAHALQLPSMAHGFVLHATTCSDSPRHTIPPCAGAGLLHVRDCVSDPPPHVTVHVVLLAHSLQLPSMGHGCVLQAMDCSDDPRHVKPPCVGAGLVHVRVCLSDPPPHVTVHVVLLAHSLQLPSMGHGCLPQSTVCSSLPVHIAPPFAGGGLVHVRVCVSKPPPHVAEQAVLLIQSVQLPSPVCCMLEVSGPDCT
jgi:hypothetical protein